MNGGVREGDYLESRAARPRQPAAASAFGRGRGRRCVIPGGGARPEGSGRGPCGARASQGSPRPARATPGGCGRRLLARGLGVAGCWAGGRIKGLGRGGGIKGAARGVGGEGAGHFLGPAGGAGGTWLLPPFSGGSHPWLTTRAPLLHPRPSPAAAIAAPRLSK